MEFKLCPISMAVSLLPLDSLFYTLMWPSVPMFFVFLQVANRKEGFCSVVLKYKYPLGWIYHIFRLVIMVNHVTSELFQFSWITASSPLSYHVLSFDLIKNAAPSWIHFLIQSRPLTRSCSLALHTYFPIVNHLLPYSCLATKHC